MALRTNSSADRGRRTTNLPDDVAFSACGWMQIVVDRNAFSTFFELASATSTPAQYIQLTTAANGTDIVVYTDAGEGGVIASCTVGLWYFWAISSSGTAAADTVGYVGTRTGGLSSNTATGTRTGFTPASLTLGNNAFSEFFNGRLAAVKIWDKFKTASEFVVERDTYLPRDRNALNGFYPFVTHNPMTDYSPNRRHLTPNSTPVTEQGPPIAWGHPHRRIAPFVDSAPPATNRRRRMLLRAA